MAQKQDQDQDHNGQTSKTSKMSFGLAEYLLYPLFKLLLIIWYFPVVLIGMCRPKRVAVSAIELPEVMKIPATELARQIANKEVTCRFVIESYIARMKEANTVVNAIVEERFEDAFSDALLVDERLKISNKTGDQWLEEFPLLGVPLTVKESIGVQRMSNTAGYFLSAGRLAPADADVVTAFRKAGAIILAVTNTPELCMNWETYNNLIGTSRNPYDTRRTCGGSSGGEAALLGAGASLLGVGSDVAGSLRLPAHYCGVFSHKPTAHVVSTIGHYPTCRNAQKWNSHFTLGPMCRYSKDLLPMMRVITKEEFQSSLNLSAEVKIANVKIFYLKNYGSVLCSSLDSQISTAFDFLLDHFKIKYDLSVQPLKKDTFKHTLFPALHTLTQIQGVEYERPGSILCGLFKVLFKCSDINLNTYIYALIELYGKSVSESTYAKCNAKLEALRDELEMLLGENGVLLMPTFHRAADFHYTTTPRLFDTMNAIVFNALGMPVSSCPIGWHTNGLPFGIQVISKRFNDRLSMAVAEEVESICGGWKMPQVK